MSEADREVIKPEMMKSYIWLRTADGSIEQVEQEVAMFCRIICQEMHTGVGSSKNYPISLPPQLNQSMLSLILDYCRFHQVPGHSNKERKSFDEKFIRMDTKTLCELTSAADSLQLKPLVDLTSRALAHMIEGKSPEEIRETFHLPDDLTEEEKLEPLKNIADDPRIRLLNRLYARKRKELQERDKLKNVEVEEERMDDRSVDDLLSFINGGSKDTKTSKHKKKNRLRKDQQKNAPFNCTAVSNDASSSINAIEFHRKECNVLDSVCHDAKIHDHVREMLKLQNFQGYSLAQEDEFDDGDLDDEIDPALKAKIDSKFPATFQQQLLFEDTKDYPLFPSYQATRKASEFVCREVEDFARRLNSDWPERMQEILSLGPERKASPISTNGNGSLRRHARLDHGQK
ncbi:hypothetical protein ACSBR2_016652 [Camellia fascicularis]